MNDTSIPDDAAIEATLPREPLAGVPQESRVRAGALEFLRTSGQSKLWSPTRAWAISTPGAKDTDLNAWELVTIQPSPGTPSLPLHDLKRWMLFGDRNSKGEKDHRILRVSGGGRDFNVVRRIPRDQAFLRYLNDIRGSLPEEFRAAESTLLMPAIDDDAARKRYLTVLRQAFPDARVLPEPEMVVEYFRLVRRSLSLDKHRNNIILVIDIGASTSNATIVVSNRDDSVIGAETGRRRAGRLQAIQGKCGDVAGQWVDEWLAARLGGKIEELSPAERLRLIEDVENAKISVSRTNTSTPVPSIPQSTLRELRPDDLHEAALEVVTRLRSVLDEMARRLWLQLTNTPEAQRRSEPARREREVTGPKDVLKLVDFVLLAGGTTRLLGFRELLESEFATPAPKILQVGDDFPIAAAVGALAHVLHEKYSPPRIRVAELEDAPAEIVPLEGALDVDILFAYKHDPPLPGAREQTEILVERGDPLVYSGGRRDDVIKLRAPAETRLLARLIPSGDDQKRRQGLKPHPISLKQESPQVGFTIDSDRRVSAHSGGVRQLRSLRLDLDRIGQREERSRRLYHGQIPSGSLAIDHADELVIDLGMSKTVVVAAQAGLLDPALLGASLGERVQVAASNTPPASNAETHVVPRSLETTTLGDGQGAPGSDAILTPIPEPAPLLAPTPALETEDRPVSLAAASEPPKARTSANDVAASVEEPARELNTAPPQSSLQPGEGSDDFARGTEGFIEALSHFLMEAETVGQDVPAADLLFTLLGLSVRPVVLLAGPPGCGKSTLARIIAHLLRRKDGQTFHDVPVQSHWSNDEPLFGERGLLRVLKEDMARTHLVLFDEINLTRPEYYLARFFHAAERSSEADSTSLRIARVMAIGTLNIDETSRAPSPKVLDRCFLVEMDQVSYEHPLRLAGERRLARLPTLPTLPRAPEQLRQIEDSLLRPLLETLDRSVRESGLREDLLPSRRVLGDISAILDLHTQLGDSASQILPRIDLLDRLIASRILIKLSGPVEQVETALHGVENFLKQRDEKLQRSRRRVGLAKTQAKLGFVFPWQ